MVIEVDSGSHSIIFTFVSCYLKFTLLTIFLSLLKNKVGKFIKSVHVCHLWVLTPVLTGFSAESEKNLYELEKNLNLKLNTRLPTKKI